MEEPGPPKQSLRGIVYTALRTVIDAGLTEFLDRHPNIQNLSYEQIVDLMLKHFLEKNPLVSQRIRALKITKGKEERPGSLELGPGQAVPGGRRLSPQQMPPQQKYLFRAVGADAISHRRLDYYSMQLR